MKRLFMAALLICTAFLPMGAAEPPTAEHINATGAKYVHDWVWKVTDIIMYDGFSPCVISRNEILTNIAAYQAAQPGFAAKYASLGGQLPDLKEFPQPDQSKKYDWRVSMIQAYRGMIKKILYHSSLCDSLYDANIKEISAEYAGVSDGNAIIERSKNYGDEVIKFMTPWFKSDGHSKNQGRKRYNWPRGEQYWSPTPPAFAEPLDPYFSTMRPMSVADNRNELRPMPPIPFSKEKGSAFYDMVMQTYTTCKGLTDEQRDIALYWDDSPIKTWNAGHFVFNTRQISPGGHWINICKIACENAKFDMMESLRAYTLTSIGLYDGFLLCWEEKFRGHGIRPFTYINRYIDSTWEPLIQTPPFPEYTAGHATISAAAAEVLTQVFGPVKFTDNTEISFGFKPRTFSNFHEAAKEAAMSRVYGGIHFPRSVNEGNRVGTLIGNNVVNKLILLKKN
ncbi:hypothetical protein MASR2M18_10410 [Ignavibacteria bacterium]|nr:vanadium-dependent haloperoxidase [Bacteroidota bacterium]MCZ2133500.1 vanadium-dependent haloperoxidase [Bacteroidota bacterium]